MKIQYLVKLKYKLKSKEIILSYYLVLADLIELNYNKLILLKLELLKLCIYLHPQQYCLTKKYS